MIEKRELQIMKMIENNLYKILEKEIELVEYENYLEELNDDEIELLKNWVGEKDKMYFCYVSVGIKILEEKEYKNFDDVRNNYDGWEDYNELNEFENVMYIEDGFYIVVK